jgi:hypothetical protein
VEAVLDSDQVAVVEVAAESTRPHKTTHQLSVQDKNLAGSVGQLGLEA